MQNRTFGRSKDEPTARHYFVGLDGLCAMTGLPEATVKNWTYGGTRGALRIPPTRTKKRRNYYSDEAVCQFFIAKILSGCGFTLEAIAEAIKEVTPSHWNRATDLLGRNEEEPHPDTPLLVLTAKWLKWNPKGDNRNPTGKWQVLSFHETHELLDEVGTEAKSVLFALSLKDVLTRLAERQDQLNEENKPIERVML